MILTIIVATVLERQAPPSHANTKLKQGRKSNGIIICRDVEIKRLFYLKQQQVIRIDHRFQVGM